MKINHLIIEITQFNFVHWRIKRGFRGIESSPYSGAYGFKENVMLIYRRLFPIFNI